MRASTILLAGLIGLAASVACATDYKTGNLNIVDPWSRATPKGAEVAAGYMKISNSGSTDDRLIGGSSEIAGKLEIHEMAMENNVMKMRPLKDGLEIKAGQSVELKPGSFHLMFVGLSRPLAAGDHFKAVLQFEKAGAVNLDVDVRAMGAGSSDMPGMKQ